MITVLHPIHVEGIGLSNVRFFAPPSGAREFPWPSLNDLFASVVMDRSLRRAFRSDIERGPWARYTRKVVTQDGRTLLGQHLIAQGMIDAWVHVGRCPDDFYARYAKGGAKALSKLTEGFGPDELLAYCRDAMEVGGGAE